MVETSNAKLDGEQVSSEQEAQKQFVIPGGPMNASSFPVQNFYFPPSQSHAAHMTYGEGFVALKKLPYEVQLQLLFFSKGHVVIS